MRRDFIEIVGRFGLFGLSGSIFTSQVLRSWPPRALVNPSAFQARTTSIDFRSPSLLLASWNQLKPVGGEMPRRGGFTSSFLA